MMLTNMYGHNIQHLFFCDRLYLPKILERVNTSLNKHHH